MPNQLPKTYDPKQTEQKLYDFWIENGLFNAEINLDKKPFTIVIPPPNVTGKLHMGHAFDETLQDILIRTKRMQGYSALWIPGTDHAGIATQIKVEEDLREREGLSRYDLGRDEFLERVWSWKNQYGDRIIEQLKKLGSSCDFRRERFTMDDGCSKAVREVFVRLYEKGLIYKGNRIINWCPNCTTALSDAEVEYQAHDGHLWHIKYHIKGSDEFVVIATTRPETMLGDTGVAVNPNDNRYTRFIGEKVLLPLTDREIPIFADEYVEIGFGTGCVKVTPCHDLNDFDMGKRHNLDEIIIFDDNAKMNANTGKYCGMDRYEARKMIINDLLDLGLLVKTDNHNHNIGQCYRCGTVVEPITSAQWFVKMLPLAQKAMDVVHSGEVSFVPDRFSKTYLNWMGNVHDWCISRQLWWGHRIPAYYCDDCGEINVSRDDIHFCSKCGSHNIHQDEDVLDTWFSSALWPFSTLGWPDNTPELKYFYPTSVLVTGYDIIFFWVARMIFSGMEHMGQIPFKKVFIHGIVRDDQGRKMSKSLGNGIDPLDVIEKYGADALRFTLTTGNSPGNDMRFSYERVESNRNFCNKIWNASRFIQMNLTVDDANLPNIDDLELPDKWIIGKFNALVFEVTENIDKYELGIAAQKLYDFIWDNFCDWYIELVKPRLQERTKSSENAQRILCYVLSNTMKLLHPFMPFITENIWVSLPHDGKSIMIANWPKTKDEFKFTDCISHMETIMDAIRSVRNCRSEMNVPYSKKARMIIVSGKSEVFEQGKSFISKLCSAQDLKIFNDTSIDTSNMVNLVTKDAVIYLPLSELVDAAKEKKRLIKERSKAQADLDFVMSKLNNQGFMEKAPTKVIEGEKLKAKELKELIVKIDESMRNLQ